MCPSDKILCRFRPGAARRSPARGRPLTTITAAPEPPCIDHKKGKNMESMISMAYQGGSVHSYEQGSAHLEEHAESNCALLGRYRSAYGKNRFTDEQGTAHVCHIASVTS